MRDPTVRAAAAAEAKLKRDAVDEARYYLFVMFGALDRDEKNPAAARNKYAVDLVIRLLNDTDDDKIRKADKYRVYHKYRRDHFAPGNLTELRDFLTPVHSPDARKEIISDLQRRLPPLRSRPGPDNTLRDSLLANVVDIVRRYGFDPTRGDEPRWREDSLTRDPLKSSIQQSACSIVARAWRELADGKMQTNPTRFERGFAPLKSYPKPLSERTLERIWDESEEAERHRLMKASGIRDTD
jgi:hypothetical protein